MSEAKYYVVLPEPQYRLDVPATFAAYRFYPGKRDYSFQVDSRFGNWWQVIPDERSPEILQKAKDIDGMYCLEGGNAEIIVQGSDIFITIEAAKAKATSLNETNSSSK